MASVLHYSQHREDTEIWYGIRKIEKNTDAAGLQTNINKYIYWLSREKYWSRIGKREMHSKMGFPYNLVTFPRGTV